MKVAVMSSGGECQGINDKVCAGWKVWGAGFNLCRVVMESCFNRVVLSRDVNKVQEWAIRMNV